MLSFLFSIFDVADFKFFKEILSTRSHVVVAGCEFVVVSLIDAKKSDPWTSYVKGLIVI